MSQVDTVIRNYLLRLVRKVCPTGDPERNGELANDALDVLKGRNPQNTPDSLYSKWSRVVLQEGALDGFVETLEELQMLPTKDEVASYLVTLDSHTARSPMLSSSLPSSRPVSSQMVPPSPTRPSSNSAMPKSLYDRIVPYNQEMGEVSELTVIDNLMFTLTGSTSDLFPFEGDTLKVPTSLNYGQLGLVYQLFEPALIYKDFTKILEEPQAGHSQTMVAFLSCIQEELLEYVAYVNTIVNPQILEDSPDLLSLRKLHVHLMGATKKFKYLEYLRLRYKEELELASNSFLGLLDTMRSQGDAELARLSEKLYRYCARPFVGLVEAWMLSGELDAEESRRENFFVGIDEEGGSRYGENKVPGCMDTHQAYLAYQIGKCVSFLRNDCSEMRWCEQFKEKWSSHALGLDPKEWQLDEMYDEIVQYTYRDVLCDKFDLVEEMSNLHSFLLLKQGDFINAIVLNGSEVLSQSSAALSGHQLISILQDSIESTSVETNYPRDAINRLDARVVELDNMGTIGWQVFTLDYQLKYPLNKLFDSDHKEYLRMFNFMFKLVRVNFLLNEGWTEANEVERRLITVVAAQTEMQDETGGNILSVRGGWILKTFKRLNILRNEFVKFMGVLLAYLEIDVTDSSYETFVHELEKGGGGGYLEAAKSSEIGRAKLKLLRSQLLAPAAAYAGVGAKKAHKEAMNLDEVVTLHRNYIRSISRCKILDNQSEGSRGKSSGRYYIEQIYEFVAIISEFVELNNEFNNLLVDMFSITGLTEDTDENQDRYEEYLNKLDVKFNRLTENLTEEIINRFEDDLELFIKDLASDDSESLQTLGVMLSN